MRNVEPKAPSNSRTAVVLGLIGIALILLMFKGCLITAPWLGLNSHAWNGGVLLPMASLLGLWGVIQIGLAIWVGLDAGRRGSNGFLWGLLVLFTPIIGLLVYLILAPGLVGNGTHRAGVHVAAPAPVQRECPECAARIEVGFKVCPFCGVALGCGQCGQPLQSGWRHCPQCGAEVRRPGTGAGDPAAAD